MLHPLATLLLHAPPRTGTPISSATSTVAALVECLAEGGDTIPLLDVLEAEGECDGDPLGRWELLSFDALGAQLSALGAPLTTLSACEVRIASDGEILLRSRGVGSSSNRPWCLVCRLRPRFLLTRRAQG